jgi:hypothetical protein
MKASNLTAHEIEKRIEVFVSRHDTIQDIINDVHDQNAKHELLKQVNEYKKIIEGLKLELEERRKNAGQTKR